MGKKTSKTEVEQVLATGASFADAYAEEPIAEPDTEEQTDTVSQWLRDHKLTDVQLVHLPKDAEWYSSMKLFEAALAQCRRVIAVMERDGYYLHASTNGILVYIKPWEDPEGIPF